MSIPTIRHKFPNRLSGCPCRAQYVVHHSLNGDNPGRPGVVLVFCTLFLITEHADCHGLFSFSLMSLITTAYCFTNPWQPLGKNAFFMIFVADYQRKFPYNDLRLPPGIGKLTCGNTHYKFSLFLAENQPLASRRNSADLRGICESLRPRCHPDGTREFTMRVLRKSAECVRIKYLRENGL